MGQDVLQPPSSGVGSAVDVTDRAGRLLGIVTIPAGVDVTDRAGRLLGIVSAAALPLPAGAATEATLASLLARFPAALVGGRLDVNIGASGATVPISAAALPLPAGAATEATLAAMNGKLPAALVGGRLDENLGAWLGSVTPTVGQKAMAASLPVVVASDQSNLPANLVQIAGAAIVTAGLAGTQAIGGPIAHDGVGTGISPALIGGYAAAAAPADVSADGDAVRAWLLRNGAQAIALTAAGALIPGDATAGLRVNLERATLVQSGVSAANTVQTITLAAAGAGLFHYITHITISRQATAAVAGGAPLLLYTSTDLNGWQLQVGNALAAGGRVIDQDVDFAHPLRSAVANTITTIVAPATGAASTSFIQVFYYVAP